MVCFSQPNKQKGSGIIDSLMSKFTASVFPGEHHAYSLAPTTFGQPMSFMGPGTRVDLLLNPDGTQKPDSTPKNKSDYASYQHDLAYDRAKKHME